MPDWMQEEVEAEETDETPEWLKEAKDEVPASTTEEVDDELAWLNEAAKESPATEANDDTPEWLKEAKDDPVAPKTEEVDDELAWINEASQKSPATEEEDDTPAWLRDEVDAVVDVTPPAQETEASQKQVSDKVEEDATWIQEMSASESLPPAAEPAPPATGILPAWLSNVDEEESESPLPTQAEEWQSAVEEKEVKQEKTFGSVAEKLAKGGALPRRGVSTKKEVKLKPLAKEKPPEKPAVPPAKKRKRRRKARMDTTMLRDINLMGAQAALDEGNISAALDEYGKLIKKKRLLDETIYDLREALDDFPIDVSLWQTLGDAYMRAGRLQEAIDAYTNAEKLLR